MLLSVDIADRIVSSSEIRPSDIVLEIGAGAGILTERLARLAKKVYSFEIDHDIYENAIRSLADFQNVELILGDAFRKAEDYRYDVCVTNLPYSQSLKFVKWLSLRPSRFRLAVATLQSEFGEKLLSDPGKDNFRAVSVIAQLSFDMKPLFHIGREAFDPQPKVISEAIRFSPRASAKWPVLEKKHMILINFLFSFRGRLLSSAIRKLGKKASVVVIPGDLLSKRIETLSPAEFSLILKQIEVAES
jgi:16S rRNA A1518/A1519 N6-dimethyltransferase RsmA/KsgA/DIM1 with predicted DNA glycosylase/AP lyase activity